MNHNYFKITFYNLKSIIFFRYNKNISLKKIVIFILFVIITLLYLSRSHYYHTCLLRNHLFQIIIWRNLQLTKLSVNYYLSNDRFSINLSFLKLRKLFKQMLFEINFALIGIEIIRIANGNPRCFDRCHPVILEQWSCVHARSWVARTRVSIVEDHASFGV